MVDNCVNVHICNRPDWFISKVDPIKTAQIESVGGPNAPEGKGTIHLSWKDDNATLHTYNIEDVYYMPSTPINILSCSAFRK